jgi:hypothetical protein
MVEIREEWKPVLNALIAAPVAWQSPMEIATALGRDIEETTDVLSAMDEADWISVWDVDQGPLITLSTLAAHRLQVVLVEVGPEDGDPRWMPAGQRAPKPPKAPNVAASEHYARQDKMFDRELSPEDAAENFESPAVYCDPRIDLTLPTLLLGQNLTPWPGAEAFALAEVCPACGGGPLSPYMYCLGCDRWGLDEKFAKVPQMWRPARRGGSDSQRSSTPNESASSVGATSPARAGRKDDPRPFQDHVSRNRARRSAGTEVRRDAAMKQR